MEYTDILFERRERIALITLNRPDAMNTFTSAMGRDLEHAYATCDEDDSIRAEAATLVSTSAGYQFGNTRITCSVLNLFDAEARDIQYYYKSRLPGESTKGVADVHFHPVEPRQVRLSIGVGL